MERQAATPAGLARQARPCRSEATKRLGARPAESARLERNEKTVQYASSISILLRIISREITAGE